MRCRSATPTLESYVATISPRDFGTDVRRSQHGSSPRSKGMNPQLPASSAFVRMAIVNEPLGASSPRGAPQFVHASARATLNAPHFVQRKEPNCTLSVKSVLLLHASDTSLRGRSSLTPPRTASISSVRWASMAASMAASNRRTAASPRCRPPPSPLAAVVRRRWRLLPFRWSWRSSAAAWRAQDHEVDRRSSPRQDSDEKHEWKVTWMISYEYRVHTTSTPPARACSVSRLWGHVRCVYSERAVTVP